MTYKEFIDDILETRGRFGCGDEYHERHHIVPKCMGGGNEEENLIDLFAREHFEAHRLLSLENPDNEKVAYALWCMSTVKSKYTNGRYVLTAQEYEEIKTAYAKTLSKNNKGENNSFYGKKHTEETRKVLSKKAKERFLNPANRLAYRKPGLSGERNPQYGISPKERMNEETYRLWKMHISNSLKGENNPFYEKKHTEETKYKISKNHADASGKNNPMYGKKHSLETKKKISKARIGKYTGVNSSNYGKHPSEETRQRMSNAKKGKSNGHEKPIFCMDTQTIYNSIKDASATLGINKSNLCMALSGKYKTAGGYQWKYLYDQIQKDGTIIPGAITLGLITEEEALKMLEEQKGNE